MDIRRIEITEACLKIGGVTYYAGDLKSFPTAEADQYIANGWAKCHMTGEQAARNTGKVDIKVHKVVQRSK